VTTYIDSSVLVAVYVPERFSVAARRAIGRVPQVPYTLLHELEVANAFALLLGRRSITAAEHRAIRAHVREDVEAQRLVPTALDWPQAFAGACEVSESCTATLLTRSLDLLHVAAARALGCTVFVSADERQLAASATTRPSRCRSSPNASPLRHRVRPCRGEHARAEHRPRPRAEIGPRRPRLARLHRRQRGDRAATAGHLDDLAALDAGEHALEVSLQLADGNGCFFHV